MPKQGQPVRARLNLPKAPPVMAGKHWRLPLPAAHSYRSDNNLVSLDRFEILELRLQGPVQTYHAREIATARPVQVHLFVTGETPENAELLALIPQLPDSERRRVIDRGETRGFPYVVTDRLAGYADFREWLTVNSRAQPPGRPLTVDEQFFQLFDSPAAAAAAAAAAAPAPAREPDPFQGLRPAQGSAAPEPGPFAAMRPPEHRPGHSEDSNLLSKSIEIEAVQPRRGFFSSAFKSVIWLILGVITALAFLAGLAAFFAFRPR